MKLPIKTGVLKRAMELNELFTAEELSKDLQAEYPGEKTAQVEKCGENHPGPTAEWGL